MDGGVRDGIVNDNEKFKKKSRKIEPNRNLNENTSTKLEGNQPLWPLYVPDHHCSVWDVMLTTAFNGNVR
jgi:hypothetical protein